MVWSLAGLVVLFGAQPHLQNPCVASANAPILDHVVLVVRNLDTAAAAFQARGFRIKQGRLHPNNLLNRHIKFRDGTSLELMTVTGQAGDEMAADYARLLKEGEGGVYIALTVPEVRTPERIATSRRLQSRRSTSGQWQFLSFAPTSSTAAIFFAAGVPAVHDPDSLVTHQPDANGLREVWVEGGPQLIDLLERLGAVSCGPARSRNGQAGVRLALQRGYVVVVPARTAARPRVIGAVLSGRQSGQRELYPLPNFWIDYQ